MTPCEPQDTVIVAISGALTGTMVALAWLAHVAWTSTRALRARDRAGEELAEEVMRRRLEEARRGHATRRVPGFQRPQG